MWNCLQTAATQKNWMIWPVQTGYRPLACRKQRVQTDTVQRDDYIYPVAQPHACSCLTRSCDSCVYICTVYIYIYHIHVWLPRLLLDMLDCFWKLLATQPLQPASSTQSSSGRKPEAGRVPSKNFKANLAQVLSIHPWAGLEASDSESLAAVESL